jgi:hypothetical protein
MALMEPPTNPYSPPSASLDGPSDKGQGMVSEVPASVVTLLAQTRPWVKLLSILFVVFMGTAVVAVVIAATVTPDEAGKPRGVLRVIPLALVAFVYIPPVIFLWKYAAGIRRLQDGGGWVAVMEALRHQKSFWKYVGIAAIVTLSFYAIAAVGIGFAAVMRARG